MKTLKSLFALTLVGVLPVVAVAQTSAPSGTDRSPSRSTERASKPERQAWSNTQGLHETGDIIGTAVQDSSGKNIGKVDALLIDPKDGKVSHAVVGLGGVLGGGKEKVVVPWSDLKMSGHQDGKKAVISIDQSTLDRAPKYVKTQDRQPSASPATSRTSDPGMKRQTTNPNDPKTDKQ